MRWPPDDPADVRSDTPNRVSGTLRCYTAATKRRERLTPAEREQFERAIEWAQWARMGTNDGLDDGLAELNVEAVERNPA